MKEPKFEIDGVFLPPESAGPGTVYFCEVQMQKDPQLYERLWQAVAIYPSRSTEQEDTHPYRALLNSDQVHRIYLDELGEIEDLPLGVASMVLTVTDEAEAPEKARMLIERANQEAVQVQIRQGIIEMISRIIVYKFAGLSRKEIAIMLGTNAEDIRALREAKEEERQTIALNLLRENIPLETIARTTGLTIEALQSLQSQPEQN